jgi:predicted Ser/Thr protein kinase
MPRLRRAASSKPAAERRKAIFVSEIVIADGAELRSRLLEQGLDRDEIVFKFLWPRYAPPASAGIRSILKSDHLRQQFERLVEMHRIVPSSVPMPLAAVLNGDRDFVGYILEYVEGATLAEIVEAGAFDEARRQLGRVRQAVRKLHAKSVAHGDLNGANIIAADDGRTLLIDPVAYAKPQIKLQDDLCLDELERWILVADPGS